jgi:hypothetical protein
VTKALSFEGHLLLKRIGGGSLPSSIWAPS